MCGDYRTCKMIFFDCEIHWLSLVGLYEDVEGITANMTNNNAYIVILHDNSNLITYDGMDFDWLDLQKDAEEGDTCAMYYYISRDASFFMYSYDFSLLDL